MVNLSKTIGKCTLQGARVALVLVVVFLLILLLVGDVFVFQLLITVPIGGALGGIIYYQMVHVWFPGGRKRVLASIISLLIYFAILWLCLVLTLSATGHFD
ncbi:MAG: hypothetical protein HKN52_00115 [Eudoraea sp.]|nr:hypothetical protein [Eudoraea sp.]